MEDLERLNHVLQDINKLCTEIKKETVKVMIIVRDEGDDIANDIQEEKPHLDSATILKMLKDVSVSLSIDAEKIFSELKIFSVALANGKKMKECSCEMLREVWFGDAFDGCEKLDGLLALKKDLEDQLEEICLETVIERVMNIDASE